MIAALKPYAEYKDSGVPWLGRIPDHWQTGPGFAAFREKQVKNTGMREKQVLSLSYGKIVVKPLEKLHGLVPDSFETYQIVDPGDIIIRSTDLQNDWTSLRVGLVGDRGIITSAYLCFKTTGAVIPEYGYQLLHAFDLMKIYYGMGSGLRQNLSFMDFKRLLIFLPPYEEQAAIVQFLNHANRRIDRFIRAKKKLITLFNEERQAIIQRAVTRGLDPNVALKPSGIPWFGDIPHHWDVTPLKFLCTRIQNGATPSTSEQQYYLGGTVPWFGPSSIGKSSEVGRPVRYLARTAFDDGKARLITGPAILVIVIGATAGKMSLLLAEGATNQQITAFELNQDRIVPQFGIQQLRTSEHWLRSTASTATIPILDSGIVNRLPLALPPVDEQERIISILSKQTLPLTSTISRLEREIELLREYRTRLIADVVTGKLDVREAVAKLPDEVEAGSTVELDVEDWDEEMETVSEETDA